MKYVIFTPNETFRGIRLGVDFLDGKGVTESKQVALALVNSFGYQCDQISAKAQSEEEARKKTEAEANRPGAKARGK